MQADTLLCEDLPVGRRRLRVSLVTETYPPEINGVAMTLGRLVEGLRARDHPVQLIRPRQPRDLAAGNAPGLEEVLRPGIPIPRYAGLTMGLPAKRMLSDLWSVRRPDLVHIATEGPLGWSALAAARKLRLPVVSGFHTNFHRYTGHYGLAWLNKPVHAYLRKFHNHTHVTLVPTDGLRRELLATGFRNVEVLGRGVDTDLFTPARRDYALRRAWGLADDALAVIHVGRLAPEKNLRLLVDAFQGIVAQRPDARLILVGEGPERAALQAAHPHFVFAGARTGADLAAHYASADLFLFPSLTETYGNTLTEAMASGLATVAFDYAAAAERVEQDVNGIKVPFGDAAAFIGHAVRLGCQPERIAGLGAAAHRSAAALSWERIHEQLEALYLALTASTTAHSPA